MHIGRLNRKKTQGNSFRCSYHQVAEETMVSEEGDTEEEIALNNIHIVSSKTLSVWVPVYMHINEWL